MGIQLSTGSADTREETGVPVCILLILPARPLVGVEAQVILDALTPEVERKWHVDQCHLEPPCLASGRGWKLSPPAPIEPHRCYPGREGGLPTSAASFSLLLSVATAQGGSSAPGRAPPIPGVGEQKASLIPAHCCWVKVQVQPPREWSIN